MPALTRSIFDRLLSSHGSTHVSIYLPTVPIGDQTQQNRIHFKNRLQAADAMLIQLGKSPTQVADLLEPARRLLTSQPYWQQQLKGLALFIEDGTIDDLQLPYPVPARTVVSDRYHLKPLLHHGLVQPHYYILALDREGIRLLRGSRQAAEPLSLSGTPQRLSEFLQFDDPESQLQWHTQTGHQNATTGERGSMFHGHGAGGEGEVETENLLRFLRQVDRALYGLLAGDNHPPVVLVGGEELVGHYRKVNSYPQLAGAVHHGSGQLGPADLHRLTWPQVEDHFEEQRTRAHQRLLRTDSGQLVTELETALWAAVDGRVDLLFIQHEVDFWGHVNSEGRKIEIHADHEPGDEELLDRAAVEVLRQGGEVHLASEDELPFNSPIVAALRFATH